MERQKSGVFHKQQSGSVVFMYNRKAHAKALKKDIAILFIIMMIIPVIYLAAELYIAFVNGINSNYLKHIIMAFVQLVFVIAIMIVIFFGGKFFRLMHTCSEFGVHNDRLVIDGKTFLFSELSNCFLTPFEYHAHRKVNFRYRGKKYKYYFGEYTGYGVYQKQNAYFNSYIELCDVLERKGFVGEY